MIGGLINHLWQSTLFAVVAGLLTMAFRRNRAEVRHWLWFCASFKFLVPFALLVALVSDLQRAQAAQRIATRIVPPAVSSTMLQISHQFPGTLPMASSTIRTRD